MTTAKRSNASATIREIFSVSSGLIMSSYLNGWRGEDWPLPPPMDYYSTGRNFESCPKHRISAPHEQVNSVANWVPSFGISETVVPSRLV